MRGYLKQPLVQFLIAGFIVALVAQWRGPAGEPDSDEIVVTAEQVEAITAEFVQTWHRLPEDDEIDRLIANYVREEALTREAERLGLALGDPIVRRRLTSKMEELLAAEAEVDEPDEGDLRTYFDANWRDFVEEPTYTFNQIYLGEDAGEAETLAQTIRKVLKPSNDWRNLGKPLPLPTSYSGKTAGDIERVLGPDLAKAVADAKHDVWIGPLRSAYGFHMLCVESVQMPQKPELADVRPQAEAAWRKQAVETSKARAVADILDGYSVTIRKP